MWWLYGARAWLFMIPEWLPQRAQPLLPTPIRPITWDCQITGMLNNGAAIGTDPALQAPKTNPFGIMIRKDRVYAIGQRISPVIECGGNVRHLYHQYCASSFSRAYSGE